jgi:hypothetical protein
LVLAEIEATGRDEDFDLGGRGFWIQCEHSNNCFNPQPINRYIFTHGNS